METVVKNNTVILAGEVSSSASVDIDGVVRNAIRNIGYDKDELGFNADTAELILRLDRQSPDIARGVDSDNENDIGAGDQGMVFGYASNETFELMPLPISLAHALAQRLSEVRKKGIIGYLRPDGKTQVSVKYSDGVPVGIDTVLVSAQHDEGVSQEQIRRDIVREVIERVVPQNMLSTDTEILVNPTGRFVIGGPAGDSGVTGRKIIVDTYGGAARHGGGAFSGKDPTKVDRSAAYAARYAAKNVVAAGLATRAEIQIAYAIGVSAPVSVYIDTFGTGKVSERDLLAAVKKHIDLRPGAIIRNLNLRSLVYAKTAAYGHFGRENCGFSWERTNAAEKLKSELL